MPKARQDTNTHTPVMPAEVLQFLQPRAGESFLDVTAGYGGHAAQVLEFTESPKEAVLVDRDEQAVKTLTRRFAKRGAKVLHQDFFSASSMLTGQGRTFDLILADLGTSSPHLDTPERGFAFGHLGPLDMRMDQNQQLTAEAIVNNWPEAKIAEILKDFGEEPKAKKIAKLIAAKRPIKDTQTLARLVQQAYPLRRRTHPATKAFQALRIAVNDELAQLSGSLPLWLKLLKPRGRLVIISFHSLEDRLVKQFLAEYAGKTYDASLKLLTKKPLRAKNDELVSNPRARSAKLRAAAKIKT